MMMTTSGLPEIVRRALVETVCDIGQLSKSEVYHLNKYVRKGWLSKGNGGPFPILKTVYAHPGFDFELDRQRHVDSAMAIYEVEKQLRANGYFDPYSPNYGKPLPSTSTPPGREDGEDDNRIRPSIRSDGSTGVSGHL